MKNNLLKICGLVTFIILLILFNMNYLNLSPQKIRDWITSFGVIAPVVFVILSIFRPLILFPASILAVVGGMTFGALLGTVYTVLGASLGAGLSFFIARKVGSSFFKPKQKNGRKLEKIQEEVEKRGFFYVYFLRMIPILNFDLISYASGVSRIRFTPFYTATLLGMIPATFAYNFLGSSFLSGNLNVIIIAIVVFLVVSTVPILVKHKLQKKNKIEL